MPMLSTRGAAAVSESTAILRGLAPDGGLYVPQTFPHFSLDEIAALSALDYQARALTILQKFLPDFTADELKNAIAGAYGTGFDDAQIAPVRPVGTWAHALELWHGPTLAFKDMALQLLPHLLTLSAKKHGEQREIFILVATSGDTGKAALEGFLDVPGTRCCVFYPREGVSQAQQMQMVTTGGANTHVIAVNGNFDDAQTGVKRIFSDHAFAETMDAQGRVLSSANSINFGRLVPQVVYYFSAYADLLKSGAIKLGDEVNFCVPTGNFGDILAADYAGKAGLPVGRLICASNENNVLTDFINTGVYDIEDRPFYKTITPSMDILVSSNLERLLFFASGFDDKMVSELMTKLNTEGRYKVASEVFAKINADFAAGCCDDEHAAETLHKLWTEEKYLCDTHTAVAVRVYEDYRARTGDQTPTVIASTASPFKFCRAVIEALGGTLEKDDVTQLDVLTGLTGVPAPAPLAALAGKTPRFDRVVDKADILSTVALLKDL